MSNKSEIEERDAATSADDDDTGDSADNDSDSSDDNSTDPLERERERVGLKPKTEKEKAAFTLKKTAERLRELGGDPAEILGSTQNSRDTSTEHTDDDEDNKPVTVGMLKKRDAERAQRSAVELATSEIEDERERELTVFYLENRIKPSGDPKQDLKDARAIVNSVKNAEIAEEANRSRKPRQTSSSSGAPGRHETAIELTPEELPYTRSPFNMTPKEIAATRPK